jgi:hypothetical protein
MRAISLKCNRGRFADLQRRQLWIRIVLLDRRSRSRGRQRRRSARVVGDSKLEAEGKADKAEGKVQNAIGGLKDAVRDVVKK